jgi:phenylacetate-CoA ligase
MLQKILASNPDLMEKLINWKSHKNALHIFNEALKSKAYRDLLENSGIKSDEIKSIKDFKKLPITDKDSYIKKYSMEELIKTDFGNIYTIERSSGYSGNPHFWPRYVGQDDGLESRVEKMFNILFKTDTKKTLMFNTFAMGTYFAGIKFARMMLNVASKKNNELTVVNSGLLLDEAIRVLMKFYKNYDQVLIVGYNHAVKELVELAKERGFPFKEKRMHLMLSGESLSEDLREYLAELTAVDVEDPDTRILSGYGATDLGTDLGFEMPITVFLRRQLKENKELRKGLFGDDSGNIPMLFQYSPMKVFVEVVDSELIATANSGIPVVRYNIHDKGGLVSYKDLLKILGKHFDIEEIKEKFKPMPLPLIYLYGRSDGTIQVGAANVYVEQLKNIIFSRELEKYTSGKFYTHVEEDKKLNQHFKIVIEKREDKTISKKNLDFITKYIIDQLCKMNIEFKSSYEAAPKKLRPRVEIINKSDFEKYRNNSIKVVYKKK